MPSNMRPCFQLQASGDSMGGWKFACASKAIFASRDAAEAYKPEFKEKCCDPSHVNCADPKTLKIVVIELEFCD